MKVAKYDAFVRRTDQYAKRSKADRKEIALYGLAGEIGSLLSAAKKKLLAESGQSNWDQPNDEIVEEIGDIIWYCFSLKQIWNDPDRINIFESDIARLRRTLSGSDKKAVLFRAALDPRKKNSFMRAATNFPNTKNLDFDAYQRVAFKTARTKGRKLLEVCLAVIWQLGAELLRCTLPTIELAINKNVVDREINVILGELAWHLAAVASIYGLSLDLIIAENVKKVSFRANRERKTPLHDEGRKESEKFPRRLEIAFVSTAPDKLQMYLDGKRLGDELDDNAYDDDGYRFHDILHLANVAHLGWSPVTRKLLGRKRKTDDRLDRVEDGARAQIVEELVVKAIHSEGEHLAQLHGTAGVGGLVRLFPTRSLVTFKLLKRLRDWVKGLEVEKNQFWEWENAIFDGANIYHQLRTEQQGTVIVDMNARSLTFSSEVSVDLKGATVGIGLGAVQNSRAKKEAAGILSNTEALNEVTPGGIARAVAAKRAIFGALGLIQPTAEQWSLAEVKLLAGNKVSVKARGEVRERMWKVEAITFQLSINEIEGRVTCVAIAVADRRP
jgi:NTP pyrophosphatase (non-canonical NTP hydrolase)